MKVVTDLNVTGKPAQFGRGVMADVSSKLLGQFAENLERDVLSGGSGEAPHAPATESIPVVDEGPRTIDSPEAEPVDLLEHAGGAVAKRVVPVIAALVALLTIRLIWKSRKRRKRRAGD